MSITSPQVGDTIIATITPADATATYQWYRSETVITGATSNSYTVTTEDIGYTLRIIATGTDNYTGEVSHTTNAVPTPVIELTGITVNNNSPEVGDTIIATIMPADATAIYQWYRGENAITGATSSTYTVTIGDIGYTLRIIATGTGDYTGEVSHTLTNAVPTPVVEIDAPVIVLTDSVISWNAVQDAETYRVEVKMPGSEDFVVVATIESTSIDLAGQWTEPGDYIIQVIAITADDTESVASNSVIWTIEAPSDIFTVEVAQIL